jgi:hypothetical protein
MMYKFSENMQNVVSLWQAGGETGKGRLRVP